MLESPIPPTLEPPRRLLCGPGPSNVDPRVLQTMHRPMLGHLDPLMHERLLEVVDMLRLAWRTSASTVLPLSATGTSGMEAGIVNLLSPGETIVVGACGYFGRRIAEIARRHGATVVVVEADWGEPVDRDQLLEALTQQPDTAMVAIVHAETSTGVEQPMAGLAAAARAAAPNALLMADCVTSLGGIEVEFDAWEIDYGYSCTQKCLGAPPGMSPIALSERASHRLSRRRHKVPFSLDLALLRSYWLKRPAVYHHTAPILAIYALHEALRIALSEPLERRWQRHRMAGAYLQQGLQAMGMALLANPIWQLAPLTAVRVPEGVDGRVVQQRMLEEHAIEIGGGLGPDAPPMWRIGLMGPNANEETADIVMSAFESVLSELPAAAAAAV
jgi:alanine-glyoxylate transaminase/serine-glyoxylate transaminase/serine-pyruvate transaminase